jgi:hypothetical protein
LGDSLNGLANGKGTLMDDAKGRKLYEGEWKNGLKHG